MYEFRYSEYLDQYNIDIVLRRRTVYLNSRMVITLVNVFFEGELIRLQGRQLIQNLFGLPFEEGYNLKGKNLLLKGAMSFLLEQTPFQKAWCTGISLVQNGGKITRCSHSP